MNFQPVVDSLSKIITNIADFIPLLVNALIVLIVGYLISRLARAIVSWILRRVEFDDRAEKSGVSRIVKDLRVSVSLSRLFAQLVFYFLLLSFATEAMRILHFDSVVELLNNILRFVPRVLSAAIILILGSLLARFLGTTLATIANDVSITYSQTLGKILEYAIIAFTVVLAVSTLGLDTTILTTSLTIIIASAGLAVALTFGLGSRESARNIIAGYSVQQRLQVGQQVNFEDYDGTVSATSGAFTTLQVKRDDGGEDEVVLPNTLLLQKVIRLRGANSASNQPPTAAPPPVVTPEKPADPNNDPLG